MKDVKIMKPRFKLSLLIVFFGISTLLTACQTADKQTVEHRKQELCRNIETRNMPQCSGNYSPEIPPL